MHTQGTTENSSLGTAAKQVAEHAGAVARLEMELAALELKRKVSSLGIGLVLAIAAAFLGLYALGFGLATVAVALAIFLPSWLALLIVFGVLLLLTAVIGLVALRKIKRGTPPVPEQAIQEAKLTTAALKSHGA